MKGLLKAWMGGEEMKGKLGWKEGDIQLNYMYRHYYNVYIDNKMLEGGRS